MLGIAMELLYTAFILKRNENLDFFFFMLKYFIFKCVLEYACYGAVSCSH